jgi:phosphatidylglycerophosphatase A
MRTRESSPATSPVSTSGLRLAFRRHPVSALLATGLGSGLSPVAPGTAGSALAGLLAWLLSHAITPSHRPSLAAGVGLLVSGLAIGLAGVPAATRVARALGAKDPGAIVVDEFAGQFLACAPLPLFRFGSSAREALAWVISFLFFRLFDIWKPGLVRRLQNLREGWGIVADDIAAGLAAAAATAAAAMLLSHA